MNFYGQFIIFRSDRERSPIIFRQADNPRVGLFRFYGWNGILTGWRCHAPRQCCRRQYSNRNFLVRIGLERRVSWIHPAVSKILRIEWNPEITKCNIKSSPVPSEVAWRKSLIGQILPAGQACENKMWNVIILLRGWSCLASFHLFAINLFSHLIISAICLRPHPPVPAPYITMLSISFATTNMAAGSSAVANLAQLLRLLAQIRHANPSSEFAL